MKKGLATFLTIFVFIGCVTTPIVKVAKTADGRYELTVSNYYCNMYVNVDNFSTLKKTILNKLMTWMSVTNAVETFLNMKQRGSTIRKRLPITTGLSMILYCRDRYST